MSYRSNRLPHAFRAEISRILLRELRDQCSAGLPTITEVKVSPDLSVARVFVSVFGSPEQQRAMLALLNGQAGFVRKLLGQRLRLRRTPEVHFVFDDTLERGDRMRQIFAEIGEETADPGSPAALE